MRSNIKILIGLSVLVLLLIFDLFKGLDFSIDNIVLYRIRLPRALCAILAGASLSLSGVQLQAVFRNPLADPHIMGISASAGTGAAIASTVIASTAGSLPLFLSGIPIVLAAFAGAVLSSIIIIAASFKIKRPDTLLLFGVMLGFIFSAISSTIAFYANEQSLRLYYSWTFGSFSYLDYGRLLIFLSAIIIGFLISFMNRKGMDLILFGDDFLMSKGYKPKNIRIWAMISSCILTGVTTALCGPIGFVGIIAPHIARALLKSSLHRKVLPFGMIIGAIVCVLGDVISNAGNVPLNVGSTISVLGIPIIMVIIFKNVKSL